MMVPRFSSIHWIRRAFWCHSIPKLIGSVLGLWCIFGGINGAYTLSPPDGPDQLTLEAQNSVICHEPGNLWIATGRVILRKGALVIQADRIDLEFEPKQPDPSPLGHKKDVKNMEKSGIPLLQPILSGPVRCVTATGNVRIHHPSLSLYAPWVRYDFKAERMDALGPGIVLSQNNPQESKPRRPWVLNCSKSLSYTQSTGMMHADGKVRLVSQDKGLESDRLCALFGPEKSHSPNMSPDKTRLSKGLHPFQDSMDRENRPLQLIWARSDVRVRFWDKEKQIVAVAQSALWNAIHEKGEMRGNVHIRHKDQYVRANKATLDFSSHTIGIMGENSGTMGQNWLYSGGQNGNDNTGQKICNPSRVYALIPTSFSGKKG
jgi:lipopolysaccharide assembly outer membrane protein LptD (OstA)